MLFEPTLSIVDGAQHKCFVGRCQRRFSVHASTFVGFPGGAANSLVTLALQVRFSLFAQHVHNIYLCRISSDRFWRVATLHRKRAGFQSARNLSIYIRSWNCQSTL